MPSKKDRQINILPEIIVMFEILKKKKDIAIDLNQSTANFTVYWDKRLLFVVWV